jgi:hypothetical protein
MKRLMIVLAVLALSLSFVTVVPALAHRPYFEEEDIGPNAPWQVDDPTISTAIYATLESATDVDYFTFQGQAGQVILLALTIPQIEGQADFAPTMALMGPSLPEADLPSRVVRPDGAGALEIAPEPGPAPTFFEPFSRTSYWDRQEERVTIPADGRYVVAVWHPEGQLGRYVFVVGEKELPGGDFLFPLKMRTYWTPVRSPDATAVGTGEPAPQAEPSVDATQPAALPLAGAANGMSISVLVFAALGVALVTGGLVMRILVLSSALIRERH